MKKPWLLAIAGCLGAAILAELPQMLVVAPSPERLTAQLLRWLLWGLVFGPLVFRASYRLRPIWIAIGAIPAMLLYAWLSRSTSVFQPVIVFTLTAGYGIFTRLEEQRVHAERARLDAEQRFSVAQVEMLRSELQPHFLFNALNTVSSLVSRDAATAAAIAEKLRDLFRASALPRITTVEDEVAFTEKYVDIQKARFEERLRTNFILEPGVETARVPSLLLQPLVENTIRHGLTRRDGITVDVRIARENGDLRLSVINDGAVDERPIVEGIGLSNTRARLQALHGDAASLIARRRSEGGFAVDVRIPYAS